MLILEVNEKQFFSQTASHKVQHKPPNGVCQVTSKQGKPALRVVPEVRLAEAVPGVCNGIGKRRHGIDDLQGEGPLGLELAACG